MRINKLMVYTFMLKKNINQTTLAELANVSRTNLSAIVNGKCCRPDTAIKIAEALGVDVIAILEK